MFKKAHFTTFKKEIIIDLQKAVKRIFNLEFKAKSEEMLSDSDALYQEQTQSLKEKCRTKVIKISKLLETIENLSSNKNYNTFNTTTTDNSCNNDSYIERSKNTQLTPPQWGILLTTSDTTTTSDNGRSISVIPNILIEEQLREAGLLRDVQYISVYWW